MIFQNNGLRGFQSRSMKVRISNSSNFDFSVFSQFQSESSLINLFSQTLLSQKMNARESKESTNATVSGVPRIRFSILKIQNFP